MPAVSVGRIRRQRTFRAFRVPAGRSSRGPIRVGFVPMTPGELPRPAVAYAVGRHCGTAVVRNRIRRRLRAAVQACAGELPPGNYLVSVRPEATDLGFLELATLVTAALRRAAEPKTP